MKTTTSRLATGGGATTATARQIALVRRRAELRRLWSVTDSAAHGDVGQRRSGARAPQHQTTATHISATGERRREQQPVAEHVDQRAGVLFGRHAAEQHGTSLGSQSISEGGGML